MTAVFYADPNRVAIYTGSIDQALEQDPLVDITRIKFHSDLPYVQIADTVDGMLNLPYGNGTYYPAATGHGVKTNLFAHGLGYTPLVFGTLFDVAFQNPNGSGQIITRDVPFSGTVVIDNYWFAYPSQLFQSGRLLELGADATHVFVWDRPCSTTSSGIGGDAFNYPPARSYAYRIHVTDYAI
jgi:hypothetical protein